MPWEASDGIGLATVREAVRGEVLKSVRYAVLRGVDWPDGHRAERAHEVDMDVELVLESGSAVVLSWAVNGPDESLAIELREPAAVIRNLSGEPVDVSDHPDWAPFFGAVVTDIVPAWHVPNEGCSEMPWSFRFEFDVGSSVVVALGEAAGNGFGYLPDELVVIFDSDLAASYVIPGSRHSQD
ncbi:hypothetical protein SAMN04487819_1219 [Actinopolyspora alba]|uniref:Uncharacterized protein n=1 Tax=Actinopolyspora alba TaxID=673379 RepID=A0A1I2CDU6_9ACTN|nr:hypothetical protein [Actinopolyspora alba]SFE65993.1 hypothetical protein SAMN04487819_1219 [Actinopolyspora alba]